MITTTNRVSPPGTIIAAFFGFLASTVTAVATGVVVLTSRSELVATLRESERGSASPMTEDQIQQAATIGQAVAVGIVAVIAFVYLWLSFKLKAGRNWARVVLTIFTLVEVAAVFTTDAASAVGYASCVVAAVAVVLSYLPASNAYIDNVRHGR